MRIVRWLCDVKLKDRVEIKTRNTVDNNLGTTAKQVAMVWACVVKKRQRLGEDMYGV